jgi:hypothetical protein
MKESETAESHNFKALPSAAESLAPLQAPYGVALTKSITHFRA